MVGAAPYFCFLLRLVLIAAVAFGIWIWWRIFKKMGMSGAWSLLMLFPLTNFIMKIFLAFSEWPIEKKLKEPRRFSPP